MCLTLLLGQEDTIQEMISIRCCSDSLCFFSRMNEKSVRYI